MTKTNRVSKKTRGSSPEVRKSIRNERIQDAGYWHQDNVKKALKMMENTERLNHVLKIMILTFKTGENVPTKQPVKRPKLALTPDFLKGLFTVISAVLTPFLR